eukprot:SAG31_NODE_1435_length_8356_cov_148.657503_7_plen_236_part_00
MAAQTEPTEVELKAFFTKLDSKKYKDFMPQVGTELSKTPLWHSDFDPKNNVAVASLKRKLYSLAIQIDDIDLDAFGTDGQDYDTFLTDCGLTLIDRFKAKLSTDEDNVTQKTEMTAGMKAGTELTDAEVQKLVKGDPAQWKVFTKAISDNNFLAITALLGQGTEWSKLLTRALLTFESLGTVKAGKTDTTRQLYNSAMISASTLRGTHVRTSILPTHFSDSADHAHARSYASSGA